VNGWEKNGAGHHNPEFLQPSHVLRFGEMPAGCGGLRRVPDHRISPESGRNYPVDSSREISLARKWAMLPPVGVMEVLRLVDGGMVPSEAIRLIFDVVCKAKRRK